MPFDNERVVRCDCGSIQWLVMINDTYITGFECAVSGIRVDGNKQQSPSTN
jgi:hypothetical protein